MADGLSYSDRQFLTAAILTVPKVKEGMRPEQVVEAFKETLIALAKCGAYDQLAVAAKEARTKHL